MLCGNTAFKFIARLPLNGSSMINSYGGGLRYGCSASVQRSLIIRGSICPFSFSCVFYSMFFQFYVYDNLLAEHSLGTCTAQFCTLR